MCDLLLCDICLLPLSGQTHNISKEHQYFKVFKFLSRVDIRFHQIFLIAIEMIILLLNDQYDKLLRTGLNIFHSLLFPGEVCSIQLILLFPLIFGGSH